MKDPELEGELRRWIGERRRADERDAPPYSPLQSVARIPRATAAGHGLAVAAGVLCAVLGVVIARSRSMSPRPAVAAVELAAWTPPTDPLLETPELELLDSAPDFGSDSLPLPQASPGDDRKEHRP